MGEHPASRALRAQSPDLLRRLLAADLRDGEREWARDHRDLMLALAPYHDCAKRLGLDPASVFGEVAVDAPPGLRDVVRTFGARRDVTLHGFGYTLAEGPGGLSYRHSTSTASVDHRDPRAPAAPSGPAASQR